MIDERHGRADTAPMQNNKSTHRPSQPKALRLPTHGSNRKAIPNMGGPELMAVNVKNGAHSSGRLLRHVLGRSLRRVAAEQARFRHVVYLVKRYELATRCGVLDKPFSNLWRHRLAFLVMPHIALGASNGFTQYFLSDRKALTDRFNGVHAPIIALLVCIGNSGACCTSNSNTNNWARYE